MSLRYAVALILLLYPLSAQAEVICDKDLIFSGIFELAGVTGEGKAYTGTAKISWDCHMHRCIEGKYSKGVILPYEFKLGGDPSVPGIQFTSNQASAPRITYRIFPDLNNDPLLVGYADDKGHEHLIFQERDEFICGDTCLATDRAFLYEPEKKPCDKAQK